MLLPQLHIDPRVPGEELPWAGCCRAAGEGPGGLQGGGGGRGRSGRGRGRSRPVRLVRLLDRRQDHQCLTSALGPCGWRGLGACGRAGRWLPLGKGCQQACVPACGISLLKYIIFPFTESDCAQINKLLVLCLTALKIFPLI